MTYLAASVSALVVDRNNWHTSSDTWQGRANNAWGSSRVWNSGTSFESALATMTADRDSWQSQSSTWQGRANNAWGASRVWNSGTSFESALATMTADRDNWQSSSNTWQSRANSAWGASRVWSSGESWEQAYNRVLPAGSGQTPATLDVALTNFQVDGTGRVTASTTINRTGLWHISFNIPQMGTAAGTPDGSAQRWSYMELRTDTGGFGGGALNAWMVAMSSGTDASAGGHYRGILTNGTPIYLMIRAGDCAGSQVWRNVQPYMYLTFVPTQTYPH